MNGLCAKHISAFDSLAKSDPRVSFSLGIKGLEKLVGESLKFGEIFEICGIRHTAKYYVAHSLLANILSQYKDCADACRVVIFDYGHKFDTTTLVRLLQKNSSITDDQIDSLLKVIDVANMTSWKELHRRLRHLAEVVNEDRAWTCFENGAGLTNTIIFITDIGSLLHDTSFLGVKGQRIQDEVFKRMDQLTKGGAFVYFVNYCVDKDVQFPLIPTLGSNWRKLVTQRLFITREPNQPNVHLALANDNRQRMHYAKFQI